MIRYLLLTLAMLVNGALVDVRAFALADASMSSHSSEKGAQVHASFNPTNLGASTTIAVSFHVGAADIASRSPLTSVGVRLPTGVTLGGLGMATCSLAILQLKGPAGCSPNSLMGRGSATVAAALGPETLSEHLAVTIFMARAMDKRTTLLFYASGTNPLISQNIFHGFLLSDTGLFGAQLEATLPPVAGLPGSPDVAVLGMRTAIGPKGLKYYKRVRGVRMAYTPRGFEVPPTCPNRGFLVSTRLAFADGMEESTSSRIPCPAR